MTKYYLAETNGDKFVLATDGKNCYVLPYDNNGIDITSGVNLYDQSVTALIEKYQKMNQNSTLYDMDEIIRDFPDSVFSIGEIESLTELVTFGEEKIEAPIGMTNQSEIQNNLEEYRNEYLKPLYDCKDDILHLDGGISAQYEARRSLGIFLSDVATKHGFDNVALIVSNHVRLQIWDGRYNVDVKNWATNYPEIMQPPKQNPGDTNVKFNDLTLGSTHPVIVNFACQWVIENEKNKDNFKLKIEEDRLSPFSQLYDKMSAEQAQYKSWLLEQPPEEILNHTYEFTVREDIICFIEENNLSDEQAKALLKSSSPLADIYKDFDKRDYSFMDEIRDTVENRANQILDKDNAQQTEELTTDILK